MLVLAGFVLGSGSASAATTEIGAVTEIRAGELPAAISGGGFAVQVSEAAGTYVVPPGYDTITAWTHSAGTAPGDVTFKVYRSTGAPKEFVAVGSDTRTITPRTVQTFAVQIPVQPGDRLGLSSDDAELAYETFNLADRIGFFSLDLPLGATRTTDGEPFEDFKLDVAATLMSPPGQTTPPPTSYDLPQAAAPVLRSLTVAPRSFAAAKRGPSTRAGKVRGSGAKVTYRADVAAGVRFTVQRLLGGRRSRRGKTTRCVAPTKRNRRAARCTRSVPIVGTFPHSARTGANSFYFTGRLAGRTLRPGSYRLFATPTAGGTIGMPLSAAFRIIRRR